MLTKVTVERVLNAEPVDHLGTINTNPQPILIAVTALPVRFCVPKMGNFNSILLGIAEAVLNQNLSKRAKPVSPPWAIKFCFYMPRAWPLEISLRHPRNCAVQMPQCRLGLGLGLGLGLVVLGLCLWLKDQYLTAFSILGSVAQALTCTILGLLCSVWRRWQGHNHCLGEHCLLIHIAILFLCLCFVRQTA